MSKFDVSDHLKQKPTIQLAPMVDVAFWALIFFMIVAVMNQMESQLNITVPKSRVAVENSSSIGKIVISITKEGRFLLNQQELDSIGLEKMLKKVSKLFPNQQVVIRADEHSYHKYVVQALDACMRSNIWDVSFATTKEDN